MATRTQNLFEQIIATYDNVEDIRVYVGPLPYRGDSHPDVNDVDVPLLIDLLSDYYGVTFHDHGDGTIHADD